MINRLIQKYKQCSNIKKIRTFAQWLAYIYGMRKHWSRQKKCDIRMYVIVLEHRMNRR